jgi:hypothetical protein
MEVGRGDGVRRIAMWSGPRNISSAMMRAWGSRPDTVVCDEPLYAHYLLKTGVPHPGRDEVMRSQDTDWRVVARTLTEFVAPGRTIFYQKHMAHHLLPDIERGWLERLTHVFLIREPREVVASFATIAGSPTLEATGLPQQLDLFEWVAVRTRSIPPVIDARDVLEDPSRLLRLVCAAVGVAFTDAMLSWPPGPRETDGVWAKYWYDALWKSTGFQAYRPSTKPVPEGLEALLAEADRIYRRLYECRLH